jgi:hypothetical protein
MTAATASDAAATGAAGDAANAANEAEKSAVAGYAPPGIFKLGHFPCGKWHKLKNSGGVSMGGVS